MRRPAAVISLFCGTPMALAQICEPEWSTAFTGVELDGPVLAAAVFDDGTGPALFVGGTFTRAGGIEANRIAKWDGRGWTPLQSGVWHSTGVRISALQAFNDGQGDALFAAGYFVNAGGTSAQGIARWDGATWSPVGALASGDLNDMLIFDDGAAPALYICGNWRENGALGHRVGRWNGAAWDVIGTASGFAYSLAEYDDGTGLRLYAGGNFQSMGGVAAHNLAAWDGQQWHAVAAFTPLSSTVRRMAEFEGDLVIAGQFSAVDGIAASRIARWNGAAWSAMPGLPGTGEPRSLLRTTGAQETLYAGGSIDLSRWNGTTWQPLGVGNVEAMVEHDEGGGTSLYVGGSFTSAGGLVAPRLARWNGHGWTRVGGQGLNDAIITFKVHDDGSGPALYAGGAFTAAGTQGSRRVARWNGEHWQSVGSGLGGVSAGSPHVYALEFFDPGQGMQLFAATTTQTGSPGSYLARWNGQSWTSVAGVLTPMFALRSHDDGSGPALFAGVNGPNSARRWNGATWSTLVANTSSTIRAFEILNFGGGPQLIASGRFEQAGGTPVNYIARWDGTSWWPMGSPPGVWSGLGVDAMTVYDLGSGPSLYIAGNFLLAGQNTVNHVARWTGTTWAPLGQGVNAPVYAITGFDDRTTPAIYITGAFTQASGTPARHIARWDGVSWSALGEGLSHSGLALASFDDNAGAGLYVGGGFDRAGGHPSLHFARWGCLTPPPAPCYPNCDGSTVPPIINIDDFTCFINEYAGGSLLPHAQQIGHYANCDGSTVHPVLNVDDFTCFINRYAQGCR
jgi:trimeric autotransporter adhesin